MRPLVKAKRLLERASNIRDPSLRRSFLERIPETLAPSSSPMRGVVREVPLDSQSVEFDLDMKGRFYEM